MFVLSSCQTVKSQPVPQDRYGPTVLLEDQDAFDDHRGGAVSTGYLYLSDTPLSHAMGFLVSQHGQLGAIPLPPFLSVSPLEYMRSRGAIPPPLKRGISAILPRYPTKTRQMGARPPSAILSRKGIARYGGVSRTGLLSSEKLKMRKNCSISVEILKIDTFPGGGMQFNGQDFMDIWAFLIFAQLVCVV